MKQEQIENIINPKKPKKKKLIIVAIIIAFFFVIYLLVIFFVQYSNIQVSGVVKKESARKKLDQQVYSVKELSEKMKANPDYFKNKEIQVKAMAINAVPGLGCSDYSIAGDLTSEDYQLNFTPEAMQNRPTITSVGISEYGIYTGHFFDKYWIKQCKKPGMFVVTGHKKLNVNLPTLSKKETVSNGYIIYKGKLLRHPYNIVLDDTKITVNGELYESENVNLPSRNAILESAYDYLVKSMQKGDLQIIFSKSQSGGASNSIPNTGDQKPQEMVSKADKVINSNLSNQEKKVQLKSIFDLTDYEEKYLDDMINNWNK